MDREAETGSRKKQLGDASERRQQVFPPIMALGALPAQVLKMIRRESLVQVAFGVARFGRSRRGLLARRRKHEVPALVQRART